MRQGALAEHLTASPTKPVVLSEAHLGHGFHWNRLRVK